MKKHFLLFLLFIFLMNTIRSQNDHLLIDFNKSRNKRTETAIKVLGGWAIANVAASGYFYYHTTGSDMYFNQMNVLWNGVNGLIVGASLISKQRNDFDLRNTIRLQSNIEEIYAINAMLDLVYMSGGLYLTEKAKNDIKNSAKWNGWSSSIIMQGGFLLLLDTTMLVVHKQNGKKLYKMMDKVTISTSGLGIKFGVQL